MDGRPEVSVVIPTRMRPELVTRAVGSALAQTVRDIEVIVVVDGPDTATRATLEQAYPDPRLRIIELPASRGAPGARNAGVQEASAEWTALLDDDDEWLPEKLEIQLGLGKTAAVAAPIVITHLTVVTPRARFVLPRRVPDPGEPISEYLAVRKGLFHGDGFIQTSTIMAKTELFRRVPFTEGLRRLQELDWALRSLKHEDVDLVIAVEPLVIWYADENRPRVSFDAPVRESVEWLKRTRPLVTPRAYAALAMSVVSSMAAPSHDPRIFASLLNEARRHGQPAATDYLTFFQVWLVPPAVRRKVRDLVLGRRAGNR